jgi:diaminohydroxyphosphoribosylaminopyrimidine deaminase/5-amino-6-(5-phosphoribosylamino)uracil reductase
MSETAKSAPKDGDDEKFMARAIELARGGRPSPNPHVGAVVVKDGAIVGEGFHERAGLDHGEIAAMKAAKGKTKGATLYVNLEPCNHVGRTPPCTEAILKAGIARVVVGCEDPNPNVEGGGIARLRAAGVEVTSGVRKEEAEASIAPWKKFVTRNVPYVSLKLGLSLDGRIATRTGASRWVTGPDARARVHALRAASDAIAVGIGTVLSDDPRLTVRDAPAQGSSPTRIVFDTKLRTPLTSRLVQTASEVPTLILTSADAPFETEEALKEHGVEIMRTPISAEGRIDVHAAMTALAERGVVTLMVEGGAELAGSFLATRVTDELHAFIAPILLGPRGRPGAVDWAGPDLPAKAPRIANPTWELVGDDAHVFGRLAYPEE